MAKNKSEKFIIEGGKRLRGEISARGSKNAALPIIAATLLTEKKCELDNIPDIEDVNKMLKLLQSLGADIDRHGPHKVSIEAKNLDPSDLNFSLVGKLRSSLLIIGPLLTRFKEVTLPQPGGCKIGARPLDTHLQAFKDLGVEVEINKGEKKDDNRARDYYTLKRKKLQARKIVLNEFSVTATENILLTTATLESETNLKIAAAEPHVQDLCRFLKKMGVSIKGIGTHNLKIKGSDNLEGTSHKVVSDYLEVGTFTIMGVATRSRIKVKNAVIDHLELTLKRLKQMGANIESIRKEGKNNDIIKITPASNLESTKIEARPYPGIPTDLQAPFGVLATQAEGTTIIHDTLFEGRLKYIKELKKMGASAIIADPHRALITGPTPLYGKDIESFDIRAGATLIIAALVAEDKTTIREIYQVDRGYEEIEKRLQNLGADIERVKDA